MSKTYTLTIDEEQARILRNACELLARCHMGQIDHVLWECAPTADMEDAAPHVQALKEIITGLPGNAFHGIRSAKMNQDPRIAWDLYQVVRHRLAWDALPDGTTKRPNWQVMYDLPLPSGLHPLAKMEAAHE